MPDEDDALQRHVEAVEAVTAQATWENTNRIGLLWVHAGIGIVGGVLILARGGSTALNELNAAWGPITGWVALMGGLMLADGLSHDPRSVPREATGLFAMLAWDLIMGVGFIIAAAENGTQPYPVAIYGGLALLILVHLFTLRKVRKAKRRTRP
ncbi:MAG: hypothetical protein CMF72_24685 [Mameliella sp.]|nr:hypothetical protein [Mameliella sp.]|tara:strand:- start:334 stop:795 length:462 start_codon:yes stop_codon:yes gene_type:complete